MTAQKGRDIIVKMDISSTFTTVAGAKQQSISVTDGNTDVSSASSPSAWREMLAGTGVKAVDVSMSGIFHDDESHAQLMANKLARATPDFQVIMPGLGTFEGPFVIGDIQYAGNFDGEATYTIPLQSAGEITFTAA